MPAVTTSFLIPVRNDAARLRACLASISSAARPPIEIIVADNGSSDGSPDVARAADAHVLHLPNRRVSQLRNEAARKAQGEFLAFIDADHTIAPDWLQQAAARMTDPAVWAVGAEYEAPPGGTWVQRIYDRFRSRRSDDGPVNWLPSGNLFIRRERFTQIQGFDEDLESCEDVDLCRKIREAGGVLLAVPTMHSVHHGDPHTLTSLFLSELWRGRDNIRVSLREPLTWRSAPSLVTPLVNVAALILATAGLALAPWDGWGLTVLGGAVFGALGLLRALRLWSNGRPDQRRTGDIPGILAVAWTYDLARALALIARAGHGTRRKAKA